jgi:hypothetical protein
MSDVESNDCARFEYPERSFLARLLVGAQLKSCLAKNRVHRLEHNCWARYVLICVLMLIATALTPELLPEWTGFEWAAPRDLCQSRGEKLAGVENRLSQLANVTAGVQFLQGQATEIRCVYQSAESFYHGGTRSPPRVLWPSGCTRDKVAESLTRTVCEPEVRTEKTECLDLNGVQKAAAFLTGVKRCRTVWVEPVCATVVDKESQSALLSLHDEQEAARNQSGAAANETLSTIESAAQSNQKVQDVISRAVTRVDTASSLYIGYTIVSLLFGRPLIVFQRTKRARLFGATLGLSKAAFTLAVVAAITMYDSVSSLLEETDLKSLLQNFRSDPCYVDPEFSRARSELIVNTCDKVTDLHKETGRNVRALDDVYYRVKLFGLCAVNGSRARHPGLDRLGQRLALLRSGEIRNPASCNVTLLNAATATPGSPRKRSALHSMLVSGVLAQLLAKIVLCNLATHLVGYCEPMAGHAGRVEVWGDEEVSGDEEASLLRFARDQHVLPLAVHSLLLVALLALTAVAAARSFVQAGDDAYLPASSGARPPAANSTVLPVIACEL